MICQQAPSRLERFGLNLPIADKNIPQTKSSPMERTDSKKRKASEDDKVVEKKAKASPVK